ncbi:MAG: NAD(P)H-hydrate epimerase [Nanoarchaeota archaeon]|nr:NAD(P)H-hydrate epimerase [Nanoarchaeota archaeon]MBU1621941.1 NAD(P)H-hydrate epimerase [Nanoarchaeota archaeon]
MITVAQMKQLEHDAVQRGISLKELMENAGKQVYLTVKEKYDLADKTIVIFCGPGNNGGDGFVAARHFSQDCLVTVLFFGDKEKLSDQALENYRQAFKKVTIIKIEQKEDLEKFHFQKDLNFILIDALLGIGVQGKVREPVSFGIDLFNSLTGIKVAVDLPSGMNPDTGEVEDKSCQVDLIVCFHDLKQGLVKLKKKTVVVDIGIDDDIIKIEKA